MLPTHAQQAFLKLPNRLVGRRIPKEDAGNSGALQKASGAQALPEGRLAGPNKTQV